MSTTAQDAPPLSIQTPLGPDALLIDQLDGSEGVSELFQFDVWLRAAAALPFDKLLGQAVTITLSPAHGPGRIINGIVAELTQGQRVLDGNQERIRYRARIVPRLWLLGKRVQSRVFQQQSAPQIVQQVLVGDWQLNVLPQLSGSYPQRDHVVQYQESDLAFVCRLLEEEGIHFFFEHQEDKHVLVLSDSILQAPAVAGPGLPYDATEGGTAAAPRVRVWEKTQRVTVGKYRVSDAAFQLPGQHLDADHAVADQLAAGQVSHPLTLADTDKLECSVYPGDYAHWFDGIDAAGGEQPANLQNIFEQNQRVARLRLEAETCQAVAVAAETTACQLAPGYQFQLTRHFDGNGSYWIERVEHHARIEDAGAASPRAAFSYRNRLQCLPREAAYRPARQTPRPDVRGTQTALVVGPQGQEIFCDKYGRIRAVFPWQRAASASGSSACWLRVSQAWAGKGFGAITIPRVGQEVLVDFLDGNPDRPIVVGSLYNAEQMPPFTLPDNADMTCLKSHSLGGDSTNFSGLAMLDKAGSEHVQLHGERDLTLSAENNQYVSVGADHQIDVLGSHTQTVHANQTQQVGGSFTHNVARTYRMSVGGPAGSGAGAGDHPWDLNTDGASMPHVEGAAGGYFQDVWGAYDLSVVGAYGCTVAGDQTYFTIGATYQNIVVLAPLHLNLNVANVLMNVVTGAATCNYFKGPVYNLHSTGRTEVGQAPFTTATTAVVSITGGTPALGGNLTLDPATGATLTGGPLVELLGTTVSLKAGLNAATLSMTAASIKLQVGLASIELLSNGTVNLNGTTIMNQANALITQ